MKFKGMIMLFLASLMGCSVNPMHTFEGLKITDGYGIFRAPAGNYVVFRVEKDPKFQPLITNGNIMQWGRKNTFIYGYQEQFNSDRFESNQEGYFYLNTENENTRFGLTLKELSELISISEDELEKGLVEIPK